MPAIHPTAVFEADSYCVVPAEIWVFLSRPDAISMDPETPEATDLLYTHHTAQEYIRAVRLAVHNQNGTCTAARGVATASDGLHRTWGRLECCVLVSK